MPVIVLRLPDPKTANEDRPRACPNCGGQVLQRWGRVVREVQDIRNHLTTVYRYRCCECGRTFRHYPKEIDRTTQTLRIRHLAAVVWALGLSSREVAAFFNKQGIDLSYVTIWRDGQEILSQMNDLGESEVLRKYSIDTVYRKSVSPKLGIVIAIDLGDGNKEILGTIDEYNPRRVKSWLDSLVEDVEIEVMNVGTGILNLYHNSPTELVTDST